MVATRRVRPGLCYSCLELHGTEHGMEAEAFVERHCNDNGIPYVCGRVTSMREPRQSQEEFWRNSRYEFFTELVGPIVMGHHLDDVAEWWMFSSLRGHSKLIPYRNGDVIRPFLTTTKQELLEWIDRNDIPFIDDPSNQDTRTTIATLRTSFAVKLKSFHNDQNRLRKQNLSLFIHISSRTVQVSYMVQFTHAKNLQK